MNRQTETLVIIIVTVQVKKLRHIEVTWQPKVTSVLNVRIWIKSHVWPKNRSWLSFGHPCKRSQLVLIPISTWWDMKKMLTDFSCLPLITLGIKGPLFGHLSSTSPLNCSTLTVGHFAFFQSSFIPWAKVYNCASLIQCLLWESLHFSWGITMHNINSPHIGNPRQTKLTILLTSSLVSQLVLIGVECRCMVEGLLTGTGDGSNAMTCYKSPPQHGWTLTNLHSLELSAWLAHSLTGWQLGEASLPHLLVSLLPQHSQTASITGQLTLVKPLSRHLSRLAEFVYILSFMSLPHPPTGGSVSIPRKLLYDPHPILSLCNKPVDSF